MQYEVTTPTTHEGNQAKIVLANGLVLKMTTHVPARYSPRSHKLQGYYDNAWYVNFHLMLPDDDPVIATFRDGDGANQVRNFFTALGDKDPAEQDQILEFIRQMRDQTVAAAAAWNSAKEAKTNKRK